MSTTRNIPEAAPMLHSVEGAASVLGVGRTLMFELIKDGRIATVKVGKRRMVPHAELHAFLARAMEPAA